MTKTSIKEIIENLKHYCIAVCIDSDGFYTPHSFVYSTLPFSFLSRKYPYLTISESWDIVDLLRGIYKDDNTDYRFDDELPFT
nr:hypothetical protein [uncultured Agathobacter sp.]